MECFNKVDYELGVQLLELNKLIDGLTFEYKFQIIFPDLIDYDKYINTLNYKGVYLIEIKTDSSIDFKVWLNEFAQKWVYEEYKSLSTPSIKLTRTSEHKELKEWFPLYIGKSKNISNRIKEHIELRLDQRTTALKLRARKNLHESVFRISTIKIDVENYDLIVPQVEAGLRKRLNPIIGRQ